MKEDLKDKTCLCVDTGGFHSFALKLAEFFGQVYYYTEWKQAFPNMAEAVVGSEWENGEMLDTFEGLPFTRVKNMFDYVEQADCIVFLDCYNGDLSEYLRKQGKKVFSSFEGADLELDREMARELFKKQGIDVSETKNIIGVPALRKYLEKQTETKWVKTSNYRKITETFGAKDPASTQMKLDQVAYKLGPLQHISHFIVESDLPDMVEQGYDGFNVHGEYPDKALSGVEIKNCGYAGKIFKYEDLTEGVRAVNEKLKPLLKAVEYQGAISTEIRTSNDNKEHYLLEPTCRLPAPPNELYQEMYDNLGEIVWNIANGELPEIKTTHEYGMELILKVDWADAEAQHVPISFPPKYRKNIKLKNVVLIDGEYYCLIINGMTDVGSIIAMGDSFESCKKEIETIYEEVKFPNNATDLTTLDTAIEEFGKMSK